jgi:site-specific DNA-adenine methylase
LAFSLNQGSRFLGVDVNEELVMMLLWLQRVPISRLRELKAICDVNREAKKDVRTLGLKPEEQTYLRINCASVMVGQLSSYSLYPQHNLPVEKTIEAIPFLKKGLVFCATSSCVEPADGMFLFIDPPYTKTSANYGEHSDSTAILQAMRLFDICLTKGIPFVATYSESTDVFPGMPFQFAYATKVPNIRNGGSVERKEFILSNVPWRVL